MKKIFYFVALVAISLLLVQCEQISYGNNASGSHNGHEYVDLGLSVKWATCNVGAESPEDYGDYFAFGELEPKTTYNWSTYNDDWGYEFGAPDLLASYSDAATVNWGDTWRMPTKDELEDLYYDCEWKWTKFKGIEGYKITGANGNSIFLPAASFMIEDKLKGKNYSNYYWSKSIGTYLQFSEYGVHVSDGHGSSFFEGFPIRPVCP